MAREHLALSPSSTTCLADVVRDLAANIEDGLPALLSGLAQTGYPYRATSGPPRLVCVLDLGSDATDREGRTQPVVVASVDVGSLLASLSHDGNVHPVRIVSPPAPQATDAATARRRARESRSVRSENPVGGGDGDRSAKRRKDSGGDVRVGRPSLAASPGGRSGAKPSVNRNDAAAQQLPHREIATLSQRPHRPPRDVDVVQQTALDKFVGGIWDSIFSGIKIDPIEVVDQLQAIHAVSESRILTRTDEDGANQDRRPATQGVFGRVTFLTRRISQTSRTWRSLEVIVQAYWVQCFDERVKELAESQTNEKARRTAVTEACVDFDWSEKELRNKLAVWRGYHDIAKHGGYIALVFAGAGLYRFCKYRLAFSEGSFHTLRTLRHRFEVAADTLQPHWRQLLSVVSVPTEREYRGHPHDWVVLGPRNQAIPLAHTYVQRDRGFEYTHVDESVIDQEVWGQHDPRVTYGPTEPVATTCQLCGEHQSDDSRRNTCVCYSSLYGCAKPVAMPVQVFRTPNGRNNGLIACLPIGRGSAVGEVVGQITAGLKSQDVVVCQTDKATYQIWQGKTGNHTRFVNHSCQPNAQFQIFIWRGTQRVVLVSKGIEAGEEITADYSDAYWKGLDKTCLCGQPSCRYRAISHAD